MKTIAWDIDDVLNDLMRSWLEKGWLPGHDECSLAYNGITQNPPHKLLGATMNEYLDSLDTFRFAQYANESPNSIVLDWFSEHGHEFNHLAVTSVPLKASHISASWLLRNFGRWIRSFHLVPSFREGERPTGMRTKGELLQWLGGVDVFIDDTEENLKSAEPFAGECIAFPRPWNSQKLTQEEVLASLAER